MNYGIENTFVNMDKTKMDIQNDWDETLLTPENIKNMKPVSSKDVSSTLTPSLQLFILGCSTEAPSLPSKKSVDSPISKIPSKELFVEPLKSTTYSSEPTKNSTTIMTPINLLELLAKKDPMAQIQTVPVKEVPSTPKRNNSSPTKSSERWAGAAFSNSPAPSSLPIPSENLRMLSPNASQKQAPTQLAFSPKKTTNSDPSSSPSRDHLPTKQPKPILKKANRPPTPPKKVHYLPKTQVNSETTPVSPSSPPTHDLDQLSTYLKSILNICPVNS